MTGRRSTARRTPARGGQQGYEPPVTRMRRDERLLELALERWSQRRIAAEVGLRRWLNNRAENSHQPFRRREGAMARFRDIKTLQKFTSVHASIHNHFNHQRHLNRRDIFKQGRAAALAEWRQLAV